MTSTIKRDRNRVPPISLDNRLGAHVQGCSGWYAFLLRDSHARHVGLAEQI